MKNTRETVMKFVFLLAATASIAAVVLICVFLFASGIPAIKEIGVLNFFSVQHGNRPTICTAYCR